MNRKKLGKLFVIFFIVLGVVSLASCQDESEATFNSNHTEPTSLLFKDTNEVHVDVGETKEFEIVVEPADASFSGVKYSYSYGSPCTFEFDNEKRVLKVTGVNQGTAWITLISNESSSTLNILVGDYDSWFTVDDDGALSKSDLFPYASLGYLSIRNTIKGKSIKGLKSKVGANGNWNFDSTRVREIDIEEGIEYIGDYVFSFCTTLGTITLPESINKIGCWAFKDCWGLERINLPSKVTSISKGLFSCSGLVEFTVGESVTAIGEEAFSYCDDLEDVYISESVETIGKNAFYQCKKAKIHIDKEEGSIEGYPWGHPYPSMISWKTTS